MANGWVDTKERGRIGGSLGPGWAEIGWAGGTFSRCKYLQSQDPASYPGPVRASSPDTCSSFHPISACSSASPTECSRLFWTFLCQRMPTLCLHTLHELFAPKSIAWTAERDLLETRGVHEVGVRVVFPEPFPVQGCCLLISDLCGPKAGPFADPFFT